MSTKTKTTTSKPKEKSKATGKTATTTKARAKPAGQPKPKRADQLTAMLRRPEGATIAQVQEAFGILPHSARAQISMLGKKLGTKIDASRAAKGEPLTYRLPAAG